MNGDGKTPNNAKAIHIVVVTVCAAAIIGVGTEAACVFFKIPDMNTTLSGAFMHVVDTLIGAMIAMLINTRPQEQMPAKPEVIPVVATASPSAGGPVATVSTAPEVTSPAAAAGKLRSEVRTEGK